MSAKEDGYTYGRTYLLLVFMVYILACWTYSSKD